MNYNENMKEKIIYIKKQIEKEETIYERLGKKLNSNPIKDRLNQFITNKLNLSVSDLFKNK